MLLSFITRSCIQCCVYHTTLIGSSLLVGLLIVIGVYYAEEYFNYPASHSNDSFWMGWIAMAPTAAFLTYLILAFFLWPEQSTEQHKVKGPDVGGGSAEATNVEDAKQLTGGEVPESDWIDVKDGKKIIISLRHGEFITSMMAMELIELSIEQNKDPKNFDDEILSMVNDVYRASAEAVDDAQLRNGSMYIQGRGSDAKNN